MMQTPDSMSDTPPQAASLPVVFLMGATACGKTDLSLALAKDLDAEIISVDSALVYRGLNIGTAKPSDVEQCTVPHHLIDVCDPWEAYSAARFVDDAQRAIDDIQSRGKRVLLVGGTMLYYKALEEGIAPLPEADASIRQELLEQAQTRGWPALHEELAGVDPRAAKRIHPNDPQRLQRALEVYRLTGTPMSELQQKTQTTLNRPPVKFALAPVDRAWLHRRIEQRFVQMVRHGFLDEMRSLRADSRIHAQLPSMRSVGYRQAWEYLDASGVENLTDASPSVYTTERLQGDAGQWIDKAIAATRQLAKRQLTWLRGMQDVTSLACDALSVTDQQDIINQALLNQTSIAPANRSNH